jgi:D-3-phosphoglycerate dehydrogenase / 2-oxoglutarate reductase
MTRVLIADKLQKEAIDDLIAAGAEVDVQPTIGASNLPRVIAGARVLIVRSTQVTKEAIDAADTLGLIVRAGSGVNTIDVDAASARGIYVSNCPGKNSIAVAELAIGLMLAIDRRLAENVQQLREGKWNKGEFSNALGIKGRRLGLVGFGSIGKAVAKRARALEMDVMAYSRSLTLEQAERAHVTRATEIEQIFTKCDVVSLHCPLTEQTRGLVDRDLLMRMKPGATLINTARAEVVDDDALYEVAKQGRIFIGTDVFAREPEGKSGGFDDRMGKLPNVYGTHHIGASTEQAQFEIARAAAATVVKYLETGEVENAVNILHTPPVQGTIVVRHLDRVGVLASILAALKRAEINVETMENVIFTGGVAACARIRVAQRPDDRLMDELTALEHVLGVELT